MIVEVGGRTYDAGLRLTLVCSFVTSTGVPPNKGFQPTAPAGARKIVRILMNAFPTYRNGTRRGVADTHPVGRHSRLSFSSQFSRTMLSIPRRNNDSGLLL
jgi:hypothetical protein